MNKILISTLLLASATAFAGDAADELRNRTAFDSGLARAHVRADYLQARGNGTLPDTSEAGSLRVQAIPGTRERAEVKAEAVQAARAHTIHELF